MADLYGLEASGLPPELVAQLQGMTQKQAIAKALLAQSMQAPEAGAVKGRFQGVVSPMEYIAKLAQGVGARNQLDAANQGIADVGGQRRALVAKAMTDYLAQKNGIAPNASAVAEGPPQQQDAGVIGDPQGALAKAYTNPLMPQAFVQAENQHSFLNEQRKAQLDQRMWEVKQNHEAKLEQIKLAQVEKRITDAEAQKMKDEARREADQKHAELLMALRTGGGAGNGAVTPVTVADPADPSGRSGIVVDGRSGKVIGKSPKLTDTGKQDQKLVASMPKVKGSLQSFENDTDEMVRKLNSLKTDPGLSRITGTVMGRIGNVSDDANRAQAKLDSIKAGMFVQNLQKMRMESPTGGAVGNVSDAEGAKLTNILVALNQSIGTKDFQARLDDAVRQLTESKTLIRKAYDDEYGRLEREMAGNQGGAPGGDANSQWEVVR